MRLCGEGFYCAYNATIIPSNAATMVTATRADRIENWRRKRSAATPKRAKMRAGYQRVSRPEIVKFVEFLGGGVQRQPRTLLLGQRIPAPEPDQGQKECLRAI